MNRPNRSASVGLLLELRSVPLFRELGADQLRPVAMIAAHVSFDAGDVIFEADDMGDRLYVVGEGKVELEGEGVLQPGDCFGELSVLEPGRRMRRARAVEDSTLLTVAREDFEGVLHGYPDVARAIAQVLTERLRRSLEPSVPLSRRFG